MRIKNKDIHQCLPKIPTKGSDITWCKSHVFSMNALKIFMPFYATKITRVDQNVGTDTTFFFILMKLQILQNVDILGNCLYNLIE